MGSEGDTTLGTMAFFGGIVLAVLLAGIGALALWGPDKGGVAGQRLGVAPTLPSFSTTPGDGPSPSAAPTETPSAAEPSGSAPAAAAADPPAEPPAERASTTAAVTPAHAKRTPPRKSSLRGAHTLVRAPAAPAK
jgi:hypothetical protein